MHGADIHPAEDGNPALWSLVLLSRPPAGVFEVICISGFRGNQRTAYWEWVAIVQSRLHLLRVAVLTAEECRIRNAQDRSLCSAHLLDFLQ